MGIVDNVKSMAAQRAPRILAVKSAMNITPNMRRITLHGDELKSFPADSEGAYVKLIFNVAGHDKPAMRTYTISGQRYEPNEIDIDFMMHISPNGNVDGLAAPWALHAKTGDEISVGGPGPAKFINPEADFFLLAADMTALPALTENLKRLPKDAKGHAFIEVFTEADKQSLSKPENVAIHWVVNDAPGSDKSPLFQALAQVTVGDGQVSAWIACEFKTMKKIRLFLKDERNLAKSHLYISSYWKKGDTEEQHKRVKQADAKQLS